METRNPIDVASVEHYQKMISYYDTQYKPIFNFTDKI